MRGSVIRATKQWIQEAYGVPLHQRALDALSAEERAILEGQTLAASLYPVVAWDHYLARVRHEVRLKTGESEETFDRRNVREAGGRLIRIAYTFLLGFLEPTAIVPRIGLVLERIMSDVHVEILQNEPGACRLKLTAAVAFRENARHHLPQGVEYLIELARARNVRVTVERDEVRYKNFVMEVSALYDSL